MMGFRGETREVDAGAQGIWRYPRQATPPGYERDPGSGRGQKMRGGTVTGNGGRRRHAARGIETSYGGWWVAGVGDVQVGGAYHWERRWVEGEKIERYTTINRL